MYFKGFVHVYQRYNFFNEQEIFLVLWVHHYCLEPNVIYFFTNWSSGNLMEVLLVRDLLLQYQVKALDT